MFFRLFLLMKKEFLQFSRNIPLLVIVLYSSTIDIHTAGDVSMDVRNFPLAVYDMDNSVQSRALISKLQEPYFKVVHVVREEKEVRDLIETGKAAVILVFPEDFERKINSYMTGRAQAIVDGSMSNASQLALNYISNILNRHNIDLYVSQWQVSSRAKESLPFVDYSIRYFYNPNLEDRWSFCLQEFLMCVTLIGILLTATAMVNEKQFGTIEQLMVTPLRTWEIMFAKIIPMIAVLFLATFIAIFVVLKPIEGIPIEGSIWEYFLVATIYFFTIAGLGLLISTVSNNLSETVLFSMLILVPILFLSGSFVAPEVLPVWVRFLMKLSPLKYFTDLTNGIFLKGNSLLMMWKSVLALLILGTTIFLAGAYRFRKVFQ